MTPFFKITTYTLVDPAEVSCDAWKERRMAVQKRKADSPLKRQSSWMSLISLTGKVRLRLRSAPLTTICHSTSFPFTPPPLLLAVLGPAQFQPGCRRAGGGGRGELDCRQAGCVGHAGGGGKTLLEANPWGCSVQGPFSSASVCLGKRRGSVSCIINEGGWRPVQQCRAAKVSPSCHLPEVWKRADVVYIHTMVMTEVKPGLTLLCQSMLYNQPWRIEQLRRWRVLLIFDWHTLDSIHEVYELWRRHIQRESITWNQQTWKLLSGSVKFNLEETVTNNELIKIVSKFWFDWILDNMHLKGRWKLCQRLFTVKSMMETDRGGNKKSYLYSAFIYSEDNHVTIVSSSNFLIKVP